MSARLAAAAAATCLVTVLPGGGGAAAVGCDTPTPCEPPFFSIAMADEVEKGERARIRVKATTFIGEPIDGRVRLTVTRSKGEFKWTRTKKYDGDPVRFRTPILDRRGVYAVEARFKASDGSRAVDYEEFRVVRAD